MTATAIGLHDYVEQLRLAVPDVHPAGRVTIDEWLRGMIDAADQGDATTFAKLCRLIEGKVKLELKWQREDSNQTP